MLATQENRPDVQLEQLFPSFVNMILPNKRLDSHLPPQDLGGLPEVGPAILLYGLAFHLVRMSFTVPSHMFCF